MARVVLRLSHGHGYSDCDGLRIFLRFRSGWSLSDAEAEYYANVAGAAEALAVQILGRKMSVRIHTDVFAAKAAAE